jgi:hypothetical protein
MFILKDNENGCVMKLENKDTYQEILIVLVQDLDYIAHYTTFRD